MPSQKNVPVQKSDSAAARHAALVVMAKMVLIDGNMSRLEEMFLAATAKTTSLEKLFDEAREHSLESLCARVERYEDRFFVALRAFSIAYIDRELGTREGHLFQEILDILGITPEDRLLIEQVRTDGESDSPAAHHPRLQALYAASSFA